MMNSAIPENYEQWHYCITVECGITITNDFIRQRLERWHDEESEETRRFRRLYGDSHWQQVIGWFERARVELKHS